MRRQKWGQLHMDHRSLYGKSGAPKRCGIKREGFTAAHLYERLLGHMDGPDLGLENLVSLLESDAKPWGPLRKRPHAKNNICMLPLWR